MENERQVVSAFKLECVGAVPERRRGPVEVSLTVYNNGARDVGCPYLQRVERVEDSSKASDICINTKFSNPEWNARKCVQLSQSDQ